MKKLTGLQWEGIYEGALRVMAAETVEDFAQAGLGCIATLISAKQYLCFTFASCWPGPVKFGPAFTLGTNVHYLDDFLNGSYMEDDLIFLRINIKTTDCAYRDSDIISEKQLMDLRVYKEIYQRDGVHYGMRLNMVDDNQVAGSFSIFRSKDDGDFTDQELEVFNKLAPLLSTRYRQIIKATQTITTDSPVGLSRFEAVDRYGLTTREFQVAEMAAKGFVDDEMAEAMSVSVSTVRKHLYNAYRKLAVNSRAQLAKLFGYK